MTVLNAHVTYYGGSPSADSEVEAQDPPAARYMISKLWSDLEAGKTTKGRLTRTSKPLNVGF